MRFTAIFIFMWGAIILHATGLSSKPLNDRLLQNRKSYKNDFEHQKLFIQAIVGISYGKLDFSSDNPNDQINTDSKPGFTIGLLVNKPFSNRTYLSVGMIYARYSTDIDQFTASLIDRIEYTESQGLLEIPILINYQLSEQKVKPFIFAGISSGLLLSAKIDGRRIGGQAGTFKDIDVKDSRNNLAFSTIVGIGTEFPVNNNGFIIQLKYNHGLTNLVNQENYIIVAGINPPKFELYNRNFLLVLGYRFGG